MLVRCKIGHHFW